jgi:hypothetical protein
MLPHQRLCAVLPEEGLGRSERLVLVALVSFMGEDETCFPSVAMLCRVTGYHRRQILDHIRALIAAGIVTRTFRGLSRSSEYRIEWDAIPGKRRKGLPASLGGSAENAPVQKMHQRKNCTGGSAKIASRVVQKMHHRRGQEGESGKGRACAREWPSFSSEAEHAVWFDSLSREDMDAYMEHITGMPA